MRHRTFIRRLPGAMFAPASLHRLVCPITQHKHGTHVLGHNRKSTYPKSDGSFGIIAVAGYSSRLKHADGRVHFGTLVYFVARVARILKAYAATAYTYNAVYCSCAAVTSRRKTK
jgi:hypothetical protein